MAMGFGKACIASRLGCMNEILDEQGAFLYARDDKLGLLNALKTCLEQADRLEIMGKHNRQLAESMDWQRIARLTLNVYQGCMSRQTLDRGDY
jgi:beta-1,4-mannosyltransferase